MHQLGKSDTEYTMKTEKFYITIKIMSGSIIVIEHKLFFIMFLLLGLNLANNVAGRPHTALPQGHDSDNNIMLRFANNTFIWVVSSFWQWL